MELICSNCGTACYAGDVDYKNKGSFLIEVVLWLCFLVPGLIYSIWRRSNLEKLCPKCGSSALMPLDTPRGKQLAGQLKVDVGSTNTRRRESEYKGNPVRGTIYWIIILVITLGLAYACFGVT